MGLPRLTGKPLTALAKELKIAPSTLTRPVKEGEHGTSTLHANTIAKIVSLTGVAAPTEIGSPSSGRRPPRGFGEEATPFEPGPDNPLREAVRALIGASKAITPWTLRTRALDLAGFMPGDVVLVDLGNASPQPGQPVCAQIYDWPKMKAETVMRVFDRVGATDVLVTRSSDTGLYQMLPVDGERVVIKGVLLPHRLRA